MTNASIRDTDLKRYEQMLRRAEKAPATVESYLRSARKFSAWLGSRKLDRQAAADWKSELVSSGLAVATINTRIAALNALVESMGREECKIKPLRRQRRMFRDERRELTRREYERLVEAARSSRNERLVLVMETICATGIRVSELQFITFERVTDGIAEISLKGKVRTILLPGRLRRKLLRYARAHGVTQGEVFRSKNGPGLSRKQIWAEMKALCRRAGVDAEKVYPHNLRHLFAREFYGECRDVVKLADVLGHSSLETTRIYLMTTGAEHRAVLERMKLIS